MNLPKNEIIERLKNKSYTISKNEMINMIKKTRNLTLGFLKLLINKEISGYECNLSKGHTNPLLWEFGHVVYFWEYKTLRLINDNNNENEYINKISLENSSDMYDSFIVKADERYTIELHTIDKVLESYNKTIDYVLEKIESDNFNLDPINCYLIMISLLHNEMHNESFLFTQKILELPKPDILECYIFNKDKEDFFNEMIYIKKDTFIQGRDNDSTGFSFDNEMPSFYKSIDDFYISKYPITEGEFMKFVMSNGYKKEEYWCKPGLRWLTKNKITCPLYWLKINNSYYVNEWNNIRPIIKKLPMCHVSWYEAKAYCKWANCRLPTESEWEYLADNTEVSGNLDYKYGGIVPVDYFENKNSQNIQQLYGNIWQWCEEPIYPYDGFIIDPVYREMSYPFFGFKKICRGGSWATPKFLINSKYRNAQMPDNRMQFIGFRIAK